MPEDTILHTVVREELSAQVPFKLNLIDGEELMGLIGEELLQAGRAASLKVLRHT